MIFSAFDKITSAQSRIDAILFDDQKVFVKRDDLLSAEFSGNKARKLAYYLITDFPKITTLVSYGSAQANSLYSMAILAKMKGWRFQFYTDHISTYLYQNPCGNYQAALHHGAEIIALNNDQQQQNGDLLSYIKQQVLRGRDDYLFIPEGGCSPNAEFGLRQLGGEIVAWKQESGFEKLEVFLPSGTGTTALFLQKTFQQLDMSIRVNTCAVVGGDDYLQRQFAMLAADRSFHPRIISLDKRYHFGKLYREFYQMWQRLNQTGIEFELLYDPLGWMSLRRYLDQGGKGPLLYLHQGGMLGNQSMLLRYRRKYGL